jgi:hypothetical protein
VRQERGEVAAEASHFGGYDTGRWYEAGIHSQRSEGGGQRDGVC